MGAQSAVTITAQDAWPKSRIYSPNSTKHIFNIQGVTKLGYVCISWSCQDIGLNFRSCKKNLSSVFLYLTAAFTHSKTQWSDHLQNQGGSVQLLWDEMLSHNYSCSAANKSICGSEHIHLISPGMIIQMTSGRKVGYTPTPCFALAGNLLLLPRLIYQYFLYSLYFQRYNECMTRHLICLFWKDNLMTMRNRC